MLKHVLVVIGFLGLVHPAMAQSNYGLKPRAMSEVVCSFARKYQPSAQAKEAIKNAPATAYRCTVGTTAFEAVLVGMSIDTAGARKAGSALNVNFRCSVANPTGAYLYGGMPVGFGAAKTPFIYNPRGGRCDIVSDAALIARIDAQVKSSAILLLPKAAI